VSDVDAISAEAARLDALFRRKAEAELAKADEALGASPAVAWRGDVLADVAVVKGVAGQADTVAGEALAGADGAAIDKALDALGLSTRRFYIAARMGRAAAERCVRRLALAIEAVDPRVVTALDATAAADVAAALGADALAVGSPVRVRGRLVLALEDFEGSLSDESRKRMVWRQLKSLRAAATERTDGRP
jgi:uracil-DNA glycosylase